VKPPTDWVHKGLAVEEWADLRFFRPVGGWVARVLFPWRVTADQVTVAGMVLGVVAAHLFYYESPLLNLIGLALFIFSDVLDSADGQLARMGGTSTRFGRILDGLSDNVRFLALYLHLGARLIAAGSPIGRTVLLILATGFSHSIQSTVSDYLRHVFLFLTGGHTELDLPEDLDRVPTRGWFDRIRVATYRSYVTRQTKLCPNSTALVRAVRRGRPAADLGARWAAAQQGTINQLAWIGTNIRFPLMALIALTGNVGIFCWITIAGLNGMLVALLAAHERRAAALLREPSTPGPLKVQEA
jgi:hypothetical protein